MIKIATEEPPMERRGAGISRRTMRAAVIVRPETVEIHEVPLREPTESEVRVRVNYCGVCASNVPPWEGRPWFQYPLGAGALGHEGVGIIDAVGDAVKDWREGDSVAFLGQHSYAEYDFVPDVALVRLPNALACTPFPAEPLACAWNILRRARIGPTDIVALVGVGFLGTLILQLLQLREISVLAITRRDEGIHTARSLGAEAVRFGSYSEVIEAASLRFKSGCNVVIEATGKQSALDLASELTREAGRLVIAGYHQDGLRTVNLQLWNWRGLDVINAHERDPKVYRDALRSVIELTSSRGLNLSQFISHCLPLERLNEALTLTRDRPTGFTKATIKL